MRENSAFRNSLKVESVLSVKTAAGIGDILHIKAQLDAVKHLYSRIIIGPDDDVIVKYRNNDDRYRTFVAELFTLLFSEAPYEIDFHVDGVRKNPQALWRDGIEPMLPDLARVLCKGGSLNGDPYIVVHTKIRSLMKGEYGKIRNDFLRLIRRIALHRRVILLGERVIGANAEYDKHGSDFVYSMYGDLSSALAGVDFEDLTVPELGFTSPIMSVFRQECLLQNQADHVITLGSGGNVSIAMSVGNIVGYYRHTEMEAFFDRMLENSGRDKVLLTSNQEFYFKTLESLGS